MSKFDEIGLPEASEYPMMERPASLHPAPQLDPADYLEHMEEFDLTEKQKVELLETLWNICRRFIELDIDIGEVDPCGRIFGLLDEFPEAVPNNVNSSFSKATEAWCKQEEDDPHEK